MRLLASAAALAIVASAGAHAQDWSLDPSFGSVSLTAGYTPDPHVARITSGGTIQASQAVNSSCRGWIANAPDYSVTYQAGSTFDLTFSVSSDADTTLVINGPDTRWACDDDSGPGLDPQITYTNPQSGRYDVWVGSYSQGEYAESFLAVSELGLTAEDAATGGNSGPDWRLPAAFRTVSLRGGFTPDPYRIEIISGGPNRVSDHISGCNGYVADAPDVELDWSSGSLPLIISANSNSDTTILINDPNGNWYCDDDGGNAGLNPALRFENPLSGRYDIWIGSYAQGNGAPATVSISELYSE